MTKYLTIFVDNKGIFHYLNDFGYEHCNHSKSKHIPVVITYGNEVFICDSCGQVVRKELTPTSL